MMDRLKTPPSENPEDGELVTRSDGSQAIRVRKRKRRSTQPHKEQSVRTRRARIIQVSAAMILIFLAALTVGAAVIFANSKPFREGLVLKIAEASGATPDLQQFRMNPKTANAGGLALDWPEGNVLKNLKLRGLNAEIFPTSFFGKSMNGEEITIAEGTLALRIPEAGKPMRATAAPEGKLPIQFNRYRIPKFHLVLGGSDSNILSLIDSEASLTSKTVTGLPQVRLFRGRLGVAGWQKFRIDRALVEFRGNETDIVSLRVLHETDDRGSFGFTGTIAPYKPDHVSNLSVNLDAFQISGLAGPVLGNLISGRIDSVSSAKSNYLSFLPVENASPTLDIAFSVTPTSSIEVQGFPFLFGISQLMDENDDWFEKPVFESDATGLIHREKGVFSFRNLNFESKGRMAIQGDLSLAANQSLSGNLRVGLATSMISKTSRLNPMFGPPQDGFRWLTVKISGSASAPVDNFKDLYEESRKSDTPASDTSGTGGSSFEELTRPRR